MRSETDAGLPRALPPDLIPDYERFEAALRELAWDAGWRSFPEALDLFREYGRVLHEKASGLALIGKSDRPHLFTRHVLDSLNPLTLFAEPPSTILDIGSGGGLPGIPLAIAWPGTRVVLLESRERKVGFLEQVVRTLKLGNVSVACQRLESYAPLAGQPPHAEAVFVRALGDLPAVLTLVAAVTMPETRWVYFLGSRTPEAALAGSTWSGEVLRGAFEGRLLAGSFR